MQLFNKPKVQVSVTASERLAKLLGGRPEHLPAPESAQVLITPPPQAINPILKIVIVAVLVTAGLVWLNRPSPVAVPEVASLEFQSQQIAALLSLLKDLIKLLLT